MCLVQTFSQYLATLGGAANKQTSLQSTLQGQNIAGLYKQQTTDDQFKVGSPSGSVYWTAGERHLCAMRAVTSVLQSRASTALSYTQKTSTASLHPLSLTEFPHMVDQAVLYMAHMCRKGSAWDTGVWHAFKTI